MRHVQMQIAVVTTLVKDCCLVKEVTCLYHPDSPVIQLDYEVMHPSIWTEPWVRHLLIQSHVAQGKRLLTQVVLSQLYHEEHLVVYR